MTRKTKTIESGRIMLSYPKEISQQSIVVNQNSEVAGLAIKPSRYVYRKENQINTLMSEAQLDSMSNFLR